MRVISHSDRLNYPFDPALNFGFEKLQLNVDATLVISLTRAEAIKSIRGKAVYFDLEEPNSLFLPRNQKNIESWRVRELRDWTTYLTIDKFSADYFRIAENRIGQSVFIPTDPDRVPRSPRKKKYDVVYTGHLSNRGLIDTLELLHQSMKVAVVSNSNHPLVTHRGANYDDKLKIISQSRMTLVHNVLWPSPKQILTMKRTFPGWSRHKALDHLSLLGGRSQVAPQLKSRLFEAAFCGSVPLVLKDPWNLAYDYFPRSLLLEYEPSEILDVIQGAIQSPTKLANMSNSLMSFAQQEYTTRAFYEKFIIPYFN